MDSAGDAGTDSGDDPPDPPGRDLYVVDRERRGAGRWTQGRGRSFVGQDLENRTRTLYP